MPERKENVMRFIMNKRGIKMDFPSKMREKNSRFGGEIGYFFCNKFGRRAALYGMSAEIGTLKGR